MKNRNDKPVTFRIEGDLSIYRATELKPVILASIEQAANVEIDLSAVTEVDTAGIQLLILAKKTAVLQKKSVHFVAHSPAVLEAIDLLDLAAYFGDPLIIPFRNASTSTRP